MPHEWEPLPNEVGNVVGIDQEVLAVSHRTSTVTAPVGHQQTEGFIRERSLSLPLVGSRREGAVHQNHTLPRAPNFYKQVSHCGASSRPTDQALRVRRSMSDRACLCSDDARTLPHCTTEQLVRGWRASVTHVCLR